MFASLPVDLIDIILKFSYDANHSETMRSLNYILDLKKKNVHPICLCDVVYDYSECTVDMYSRQDLHAWGFFSPWFAKLSTTPRKEFFVWFSRENLFHSYRMSALIYDLDFRVVKPLFYNFPITPRKHLKSAILHYINQSPEDAALALSPVFYNLRRDHLCTEALNSGRFFLDYSSFSETLALIRS